MDDQKRSLLALNGTHVYENKCFLSFHKARICELARLHSYTKKCTICNIFKLVVIVIRFFISAAAATSGICIFYVLFKRPCEHEWEGGPDNLPLSLHCLELWKISSDHGNHHNSPAAAAAELRNSRICHTFFFFEKQHHGSSFLPRRLEYYALSFNMSVHRNHDITTLASRLRRAPAKSWVKWQNNIFPPVYHKKGVYGNTNFCMLFIIII